MREEACFRETGSMVTMMKLAFTTAGCPGWSFDEIFAAATDLAMDGIEIRGVGDEMYAPDCPCFSPAERARTIERMNKAGVVFPVLDSAAALGVPGGSDAAGIEARAYVDLASALHAPYVRVMITPRAEPTPADEELCLENYRALCDYAAGKGVTPLLETNGVFADTAVLSAFLDKAGRENSGVLWDVHHPFRYFGEAPELTVSRLGKRIRHVHVKDSVVKDSMLQYRMMGYGDVPILDAVRALNAAGYEGMISLEWLKRWNPDLQEPGIVFAHYKNYMEFIFTQL